MSIRHIYFFIALLYLIGLSACSSTKENKEWVIGVSQCVESDLWRKTMLEEMKRELSFHSNIKFYYREADGNSQLQVKQVKELLKKKIDILIISPNEAQPLTPIVEETINKGIPVIVVDRKIATTLYTAYIGGDNYEIGRMAGEYAVHLLNAKGKVLEITGLPRSTPAIDRHKGFTDALKKYPNLQISKQINGEWLNNVAKKKVTDELANLSDIDLVFAHNDMMAHGAFEVFKNAPTKPLIMGVDGLPGGMAGMQFVRDRSLIATMLYPTGGEEAIQMAIKVLNGEEYKKENLLQTTVIDSTNVRLMQRQADKLTTQQKEVERQQLLMAEQRRLYNNQRTFLYILISSLVLVITLGSLSFYSLRENRKINKKLQAQNEEISDQRNQLVEMSAKAQAANEAKVNFFTNISHEFRTPLTLILGPLEALLTNTKTQSNIRSSLILIQKNVIRLLRLVNQLMDFRKIEVDKMQLRASENDLILFVSEIIASYKSIAQERGIDLRLITIERQLMAWFDVTMIDKVIFNLLSNAFKFTNDNGFVHLYISRDEKDNKAIIKVEDNGVGMTPDAVAHSFEVFYQGEFENYKGSGLGLALSKNLIQLHKGTITVKSEKWKGTTFEVKLPLGSNHLSEEEMTESQSMPWVIYEQEKIYTTDLHREKLEIIEEEGFKKQKDFTVLVIEDHQDLRRFVATKLKEDYEVLEADNGQAAVQIAFDHIPDLIICDVVIPGKDGMALTNLFKNDIRTSHIPIILLTAKTSIDQQIEGMKSMADAYITKPFNLQFLVETVKSLLANRAKLKEHFTGEMPSNLKTQTVSKLDRKFINEFYAMVESNISNEAFSVEDICTALGISRVQLYRKVKALLNININDYILNTRLQKAKYLLQHEDFSIGEIAYKVGFSSPAYFSTVFKSKFGVTPKGFKEK